jgi:apolipoprotein D and lipocalin family protein
MMWRNVMLMFAAISAPAAPLEVVPKVDLARYAGKWYEVARLPNRFQRDCAGDTSATYSLRPDGKIKVVNECRKADGKVKQATGTARLAAKEGPNTKLKVTFFWPFSGDYWIIGLDPDYRWAAIGEPSRRYFWVLSRTPSMDEATLRKVLEDARRQGYDLSTLLRTPQSGR